MILAAVGLSLALTLSAPEPLLTRAHAHNDYWHKRPLLDALEQGFPSVEADVFLVAGKFLVGHDTKDLKPEKTLEKLYLDPLAERVKLNGGHVYPGGGRFILLVEFKSEGEEAYLALRKLLPKYKSMLTEYNGSVEGRAVTIILTGRRPAKTIASQKQRYDFIDGELSDLDGSLGAEAIPLISDDFEATFGWDGKGEMPTEKVSLLRSYVQKAHEQGRLIRFWGAPDTLKVWKTLYENGVDLVNTDRLPVLRKYLLGTGKP